MLNAGVPDNVANSVAVADGPSWIASQSLAACVTKLDIVSVTVVAAYSDIEHDNDDPYVSLGDDEMYDTSVEDKSIACAAPGQKSSMYNVVCT